MYMYVIGMRKMTSMFARMAVVCSAAGVLAAQVKSRFTGDIPRVTVEIRAGQPQPAASR
jgi:hypothetical protein